MIDELYSLIEDFLDGEVFIDDFKTDLSVILDMDYDTLREENEDIITDLHDLIDVCDEYIEGSCVMTFMEKVGRIYEEIQSKI